WTDGAIARAAKGREVVFRNRRSTQGRAGQDSSGSWLWLTALVVRSDTRNVRRIDCVHRGGEMYFDVPRKGILLAALLGASPLVGYAQASAEFPARPMRLIVPVSAGGGLDTTTRAIARKLTQAWGQQVIVDNRPGASGRIAFDIAIKSAPDGHTLLMMSA